MRYDCLIGLFKQILLCSLFSLWLLIDSLLGFLGYILNWGNMSYWGINAMINMPSTFWMFDILSLSAVSIQDDIMLLQCSFLLSFCFISLWILFTCSFWMLYFGLELQWVLLTIMFIIGSSVHRGLFNYLMLNGILSIRLIVGIVFGNSIFYVLAVFGKIGYFPFSLVLSSPRYYSIRNQIF